ncbi:hypothetical protein M409DRAFT_27900 [Zasmidium cellare ATCC 36951]|uniref:HTH La-type RNA-binding domain-containing protein n=1 Tax=Zasmidium cellare ATCC 36951 TaxID=1080233 RepID=A0A6A6C402_ZASCE|nr:uncharacterized protein M409DRAFT_27900 [Zasmidium cellare ATCC 36951]KAF2161844.1 hypothetical protein M409DRAFT_27900 [Zasmidium cellare ATCC 36951]
MAAVNSSPSGFSYAQAAAKAHAPATNSQTPSSKVTSGTATPATGTFSELGPNSNWADDVEATEGDKTTESRKTAQKQAEPSQAKDSAVERTKSESRAQNGSSGVSSPDLTASSSTTNTDDASSAPSGGSSSETTWDTKSQNSEPAWIAERKERQSGPADEGRGKRGKKEGKESKEAKEAKEATEAPIPQPPPKPVVLHDAPPPAVNPWAKRMENAKSKPAAPISIQSLSRPAPPAPHTQSGLKENQRPRADSRKKANSVTSVAREAETPATGDVKKAGGVQGKRANQVRPKSRQGSKPVTEDARTDSITPSGRPAQREHQSLPNLNTAPPPVKDEVSWPTPETAQETQRKEAATAEKDAGKEADESGDAEQNAGAKSRPKTTWKPIPVTPTIVWETEEMNRPRGQGERGGRGGAGRGRGGFRGAPNGGKAADRAAARGNGSPEDAEAGAGAGQRGRSNTVDREAMPPPPKPVRPSSASESRDGRKAREQSFSGRQRFAKGATDGFSGSETTAPSVPFSDARRAKSPSKMDDTQDVKIPEPIPRRSPSDSQRESSREDGSSREGSATKATPGEGKKESRSFESHNGKEWNGAPRGGKRNGRGRGGSRESINGHQANQMFPNGHAIEFAGGNPFASPTSPASYQPTRGQFNYGGRGGWPRNPNPRSQSIPVDSPYAGARPYWPQPPPPMQTYYPNMYDYQAGVPMSAMPYNPMMDQQYLMDMISTQLEYYFSIDNLIKDMYLRRNMDSQGYVFLDIIANFNRIKQLTVDKEMLKAVCLRSDIIEIRVGDDGKERLRRHNQWEQFLLPVDQRDASAQNDGPQNAKRPEHPQIHIWSPPMGGRPPPYPATQGPQRRSYDAGFGMSGTVPSFAPFSPLSENPFGDVPNGDEIRGRAAKSPIRENSASPMHQAILNAADGQDTEPDVFPDEHAGTLTVVVKMNPQRAHHHAAARTFSNGSIDTRSVFNDLDKTVEGVPATNGEPVVNGEKHSPNITRLSSPGIGRSPEKTNGAAELMLLWVKDKEVPQDNLPQDATLEPYIQLHQKALDQRKQAATGTCPYDLDVLYQFWSHFLIRNFNRRMYAEFKMLAHGDAEERHNKVGLQNLVQFYAKALGSSNTIRDHVVNDYVQLVKNEPQITKDLAFKQLRSAWRNGALNLKNRKKLTEILDESLRDQLES